MYVQVQVLRRVAQTNRRILAQVLLQTLKIVKDMKKVMPSPDYCCIQRYVSLSVCLCKCVCIIVCLLSVPVSVCVCVCMCVHACAFVFLCVCVWLCLCL